ncbi:hypothetical protein Tco_0105082 [Tanacetum coccineum]
MSTKIHSIISSDTNYEWEQLLDIDDYDLPLTPILRPCNSHVRETTTTTTTQNTAGSVQVEETPVRIITGHAGVVQVEEKAVRIIPGPASIVQLAKLRYIENYLKNGKLEQVVVIIKSCNPNAIGDLTVTLKDLSSTIHGTIHHKVIDEGGYGKDITVGSGSGMLMEEEEIVKLMEEEEMADLKLQVCWNVTHQEMADEEALNISLDEEARQAQADQEWLEKSEGGGALGALEVNKASTHPVIDIFMYPLGVVEAACALEVDAMGALDLVEVEAVGSSSSYSSLDI